MSFIVINRNYGHFIGSTIDSIRTQDYPRFECLVVDNASTDDSWNIINRHVDSDARFKAIRLDENLGQYGASLTALALVSGDFVCIVDSDDYLFPHFASFHIQVHMLLDEPVAISSSNHVTIDAEGVLLSGGHQPATINPRRERVSRSESAKQVPTIDRLSFDRLQEILTPIRRDARGWHWPPGTSNVYRRTAMELARRVAPPLSPTRRAADLFFNILCHMIGGTMILDIPLSAYRVHSGNDSSAGILRMAEFRHHKEEAIARYRAQQNEICATLIRNRSKTLGWIPANRFWPALEQILQEPNRIHDDFADVPIASAISDNFDSLARELGTAAFLVTLRRRMRFADLWRIVTSAKVAGSRLASRRGLLVSETLRRFGLPTTA